MRAVAKTVLLVDDEVFPSLVEKHNLEKHGYSVVMVHSGEDAVKTALEDDAIDLILMDIDLGDGIDGTEAALRILEKKTVPIVFLSSHSDRTVVEKTEKIASYGYVLKKSGITVMDASIKMAFKLFETRQALEAERQQLRAAQESLRESERNYHLLVTSMNQGVALHEAIVDAEGVPVDAVFLEMNERYAELLGITAESAYFEDVMQAAGRYFSTYAYSPKRNQVTVLITDITERKKKEMHARRTQLLQKARMETEKDSLLFSSTGNTATGISMPVTKE